MRKLTLLAFLLLTALAMIAQEGPPSVNFASASPVVVAPGRTGQVKMVFEVGKGFHINSHKPNDELLVPTEVKLSPPTEIMISKIQYPAGESLSLSFSPDTK